MDDGYEYHKMMMVQYIWDMIVLFIVIAILAVNFVLTVSNVKIAESIKHKQQLIEMQTRVQK